MSGSMRRRHSKWDYKDSEALPESFHDRIQPRKPREPVSPGRGPRRHDSRSKERMACDREGNSTRVSPGLDEWRHRHQSRSPRNGWGRTYRSSRSRSRSQSPAHKFRREPELNDRSRNRSGVSTQICKDFAGGRCRKGSHCQFLHHDAQPYESRRPLDCSSPDDWESRHRRNGSSRYSPDDTKDYLRSEKSTQICGDFLKGRCRRGASCKYVHQDTDADVSEKGLIDDVYRDRDHDRGSRDTYSHRNHDREPPKRGEILCKFFASGNCRNGNHCRFSHQPQEGFSPERRSEDDRQGPDRSRRFSHQLREDFSPERRSQDDRQGPDRSRRFSHQPQEGFSPERRSEDDRQGPDRSRRFSHQLREDFSPERRSQDDRQGPDRSRRISHQLREGPSPDRRVEHDRQGPDHNFEGDQVWHGARWSDVNTGSDVPPVQGWGEGKHESTEVSKEVGRVRSGDDSWSHDMHNMHNMKQTWDAPATIGDEPRAPDATLPFQWKQENSASGMDLSTSRGAENIPGDMEISLTDIKLHALSSSNAHTPSLSSISLPAVHQDTATGDLSYEKPFPVGFHDQRVYNDHFSRQNPSYNEDKQIVYSGQGRNVGINDGSCIVPSQPMNPLGQGIFQTEQIVNVQPITVMNPSVGQGQPPFPSNPSGGDRIQISHNPSLFPDSKVADGHQVVDANSSALASETAACLSSVSSEQLVQLSHLSASLAQLLESRQQLPQLPSAVTSNLPDSAALIPLVSATMIQPNQATETLKKYDPLCDSIEADMPNLGNQVLPNGIDQKISNSELNHEGGNINQHEPLAASNVDENGKKTAEESSKALEKGPSEDMAEDDGADDAKKPKDAKVIRPFKFALAEFVKELLKPSWKDGHVNKDAYKTIVKKVVDKVIETQGIQIPQTKEKIDQYLSCSKPKIEKLVQAYVGKLQKS